MLVLARAKSALPLLEENDAIVKREVLRFTMMLEETLGYIRDYRKQPNYHRVLYMPSACFDLQHSIPFTFPHLANPNHNLPRSSPSHSHSFRYYLALNVQNGNGYSMLAPRRAPNWRKHINKHVSSDN